MNSSNAIVNFFKITLDGTGFVILNRNALVETPNFVKVAPLGKVSNLEKSIGRHGQATDHAIASVNLSLKFRRK